MPSVNKVILLGCLGKDPEVQTTTGGKTVCKFSLATTEYWKGADGKKQSKTIWHNVVVWGKLAETSANYLSKGSLVYIEGSIDIRSWDDKSGQKKQVTEIRASVVQFLQTRAKDSSSEGSYEAGSAQEGMPF